MGGFAKSRKLTDGFFLTCSCQKLMKKERVRAYSRVSIVLMTQWKLFTPIKKSLMGSRLLIKKTSETSLNCGQFV